MLKAIAGSMGSMGITILKSHRCVGAPQLVWHLDSLCLPVPSRKIHYERHMYLSVASSDHLSIMALLGGKIGINENIIVHLNGIFD